MEQERKSLCEENEEEVVSLQARGTRDRALEIVVHEAPEDEECMHVQVDIGSSSEGKLFRTEEEGE